VLAGSALHFFAVLFYVIPGRLRPEFTALKHRYLNSPFTPDLSGSGFRCWTSQQFDAGCTVSLALIALAIS